MPDAAFTCTIVGRARTTVAKNFHDIPIWYRSFSNAERVGSGLRHVLKSVIDDARASGVRKRSAIPVSMPPRSGGGGIGPTIKTLGSGRSMASFVMVGAMRNSH